MELKSKPKKADIILVAAGRGVRLGAETPKQFIEVAGRPLFLWSLDTLMSWQGAGHVVVVVPLEWVEPVQQSLKVLEQVINPQEKAIQVIAGGSERQESVRLGLEALLEISENKWVMIHDAVRPLFSKDLCERLWIEVTEEQSLGGVPGLGGVIPGTFPSETVKKIEKSKDKMFVSETIDREGLCLIQTPQLMQKISLLEGYQKNKSRLTDDAAVMESLGLRVKVIEGERKNIKLTYEEDLEYVSHWLRKRHPPV